MVTAYKIKTQTNRKEYRHKKPQRSSLAIDLKENKTKKQKEHSNKCHIISKPSCFIRNSISTNKS